MQIKNTNEAYGAPAKFLHWLIALLIICMLVIGFLMEGMALSPDKFKVYGLHKSVGITILALAALRLAWKMRNRAPGLPASMLYWEKIAARAGHALLYVMIIAMPVSGWAMSSAKGLPVSVFGLFMLPNLVSPDKNAGHMLEDLHKFIAYGIIAMVSLHVLAALLHHFYYKDNVLRRMLPFVKVENNADVANPGIMAD